MFGKRKRVVSFTIVLFLLGFCMVANSVMAAYFYAPPKVIGIVEPRSGVYAEIGEDGIKGVQLAVDKYNAAGGVLG